MFFYLVIGFDNILKFLNVKLIKYTIRFTYYVNTRDICKLLFKKNKYEDCDFITSGYRNYM